MESSNLLAPKDRRTPLYSATLYGHVEVAKLLIDNGAQINIVDIYGYTPLHNSLSSSEITACLIQNRAQIDAKGYDGRTPLHIAVHYNFWNGIKCLIDTGASINAKDQAGWTPLHMAADIGSLDVTKYLVEHGAQLNSITNFANIQSRFEKNCTPFELAYEKGHMQVADYLLEMESEKQNIREKASYKAGRINCQIQKFRTLNWPNLAKPNSEFTKHQIFDKNRTLNSMNIQKSPNYKQSLSENRPNIGQTSSLIENDIDPTSLGITEL